MGYPAQFPLSIHLSSYVIQDIRSLPPCQRLLGPFRNFLSACTEIFRFEPLNFCRSHSIPFLPEPPDPALRRRGKQAPGRARCRSAGGTHRSLFLPAHQAHVAAHALVSLSGDAGEDAVGPLSMGSPPPPRRGCPDRASPPPPGPGQEQGAAGPPGTEKPPSGIACTMFKELSYSLLCLLQNAWQVFRRDSSMSCKATGPLPQIRHSDAPSFTILYQNYTV